MTGTRRCCSARRDTLHEARNFDGTVNLIFQPAEEGLGGGEAMVKDGLFDGFPCDAIFGMHNRPGLAIGKFQIRTGPMMAGGAYFDITVTGRGAHGARPEAGIDPVIVASHITTALQTIVSRNVTAARHGRPQRHADPCRRRLQRDPGAGLHPRHRTLLRSRTRWPLIEENMRRIASGVAGGFGATASLDFRILFPPLVNDAAETEFIAETAAELVGDGQCQPATATWSMASEDFSYMLERRPGAYIQIGNGDGAGGCEVHNPGYDFNDMALPFGASLFVRLVERRLARLGRRTADQAACGVV